MKNNKINEIKVPIEINNKIIHCIIDTGASMSFINKSEIDDALKLGLTGITPTRLRVLTANGDEADILGVSRCKIRIDGQECYVEMLVSPNKLKDTLIVMDV